MTANGALQVVNGYDNQSESHKLWATNHKNSWPASRAKVMPSKSPEVFNGHLWEMKMCKSNETKLHTSCQVIL